MEPSLKLDLFSDDNSYYKNAYDLPNLSPLSWKYTEFERKRQPQRDQPHRNNNNNNNNNFKRKNFERPQEERKDVVFKKFNI